MVHFNTAFVSLLLAAAASAVPLTGRTNHEQEAAAASYEGQSQGWESKESSYAPKQEAAKEESYAPKEEAPKEEAYAPATSSAAEIVAAPSSEAAPAYETPSYGSGSSNWQKGSGYDDCVSQCMAKFGSQPGSYSPPPEVVAAPEQSGGGGGATHTVIVAPTQGVLRYVPPVLNASVGDTIFFQWNAKNHTVTKSSLLTPCNKSEDASSFATGQQSAPFTFTQVVNDTNPLWFFCGTPGHCQKGMFGLINPPTAAAGNGTSNTTLGAQWETLMSNSSDLSAYNTYTQQMTANDTKAANWGSSIDIGAMPEWAQPLMAENVMYMRNVLAMNPDLWNEEGQVDLSSTAQTPMMVPQDLSAALASTSPEAGSGSTSSDAAPPAQSSDAAANSPAGAAAANQPSGALSVTSSKMVVAAVAVIATAFLL